MVSGPKDCKEVQIFNPETKRCIAINGAPGKKLVKLFETNKIKLPEEEIKKIIKELKWNETSIKVFVQGENQTVALKCLQEDPLLNQQVNSPKSKKNIKKKTAVKESAVKEPTVKQSAVKEFVKESVKQSAVKESAVKEPVTTKSTKKSTVTEKKICKLTEIWNPITKRCISISGTVAKKLIKDIITGTVEVDQEDLDKLISSYATTYDDKQQLAKLSPNKTVQPNQIIPAKEIPEDVKNKVHKFVEAWKKKKENEFLDEHHKKYCTTNKISDLKAPIVNWSAQVQLPLQRMTGPPGFLSMDSLNKPKQPFTLQHIEGIVFTFNNYSVRNILYKNMSDSFSYIENMVDPVWFEAMNKYVINLPTKDIYTMIGYTFYGDTVANHYMRKSLNKNTFTHDLTIYDKWWFTFYPLFFQAKDEIESLQEPYDLILKDKKDVKVKITSSINNTIGTTINAALVGERNVTEIIKLLKTTPKLTTSDFYIALYHIGRYLSFIKFWQHVIIRFIKDLDNIIQNAPPLTKKLIVYRGVKSDYYLKGKEGFVYTTNSFVSTSVNLGAAMKFANPTCCFKRITLLPGTRTLLLAGISKFMNEVEILLGTTSKFYITKEKHFISKDTTAMCQPKLNQKILVTDAVVIKT